VKHRKRNKTIVISIAAAATTVLAAIALRGLLPEAIRYLRIRRM
jgi:hypothetical protein